MRPRRPVADPPSLVSGEAGIGKTSLVGPSSPPRRAASGCSRAPARTCSRRDRWARSATPPDPSPARSPTALAAPADTEAVFAAAADELAARPRPTVLVVEDAHWADGATLDVLRYLGRRVHELPAVLVITFRDDALDQDHPLRRVLGGLHRCRRCGCAGAG